jgi:Tol biopolymer transport system component
MLSFHFPRLFKWCLLIGLLTAASAFTLSGRPQAHENQPYQSAIESMGGRSRVEVPKYLAHIHDEDAEQRVAAVNINSVIPGSVLVFQSYRTGQWQVYRSSDDGTNQIALTNTPLFNILPRLSRGATKMVFLRDVISTATYWTEIRFMDLNGIEDPSVYFTYGQWAYPSWSPDNEHIVASYTSNPALYAPEIHLANSETRDVLTNNSVYDSMPAWSPDGRKIAWVSQMSGGYRIWVMNVDGSNKTMLSTQPYSFRPVWSPDGTMIAYDADSNGDGWQEVWVMNADGSNQRQLFNPVPGNDAWVYSWSPDGRYITFTNISFIFYQGNWYWTKAFLDAINIHNGSHIRMSSSGLDWSPDWQMIDVTPPQTRMLSLPEYSLIGGFAVQWETRNDYAPTDYYEVQYREAGQPTWQSLGTTVEPYLQFDGEVGHTYLFRARAADKAGNLEAWHEANVAQTTVYSHRVKGELTDNRGAPLDFSEVSFTPSALANTQYPTAYHSLLKGGDHEISISAPSYGVLPDTRLPFASIRAFDFVMPPTDNVLVNSQFEETASNAWLLGGYEPPAYDTWAQHTGQYGLALGSAPDAQQTICVRPPGDPGLPACDYTSIQDAIDSNRTIWVYPGTYQENISIQSRSNVSIRSVGGPQYTIIDGNNNTVFYVASSPNTLIEGFTIINGGDNYQAGAVYVWGSGGSKLINNRLINNSSGLNSAVHVSSHDVTIRQNWFIKNYARYFVTTSRPACIYVYGHNTRIENNVFWLNKGQNTGSCIESYYTTAPLIHNNTFVANRENIWPNQNSDIRNNILVDSDRLGLGKSGYYPECIQTVYYNNVWGNWRNYLPPCPDQTGSNGNIADDPGFLNPIAGDFRLRFDSPAKNAGDPNPEYNDLDGSRNDMGAYGGSHAMPIPLPEQEPTASWSHYWLEMGSWLGEDITITLGIKDDQGMFRSAISQAVTLTGTLSNPTLSFMYEMGSEHTPGDDTFVVHITSATASSEFVVAQNETSRMWVNLDEVTLGSTYPDVWVHMTGGHAEPGTQIQRVVSYGNQGSILAESAVLTVTLPTEFTLVSASLPPEITGTTLVWNLGDLDSAVQQEIVLTLAVADTAVLNSVVITNLHISTSSRETALLNNHRVVETEIAYLIMLPAILK